MKNRRRNIGRGDTGFTLVELLAVMVIMAVLVSLVVAVGTYVREDAARRKTSTIQAMITQAIQEFYDEVGRYPGIDENGNVDGDLDGDLQGSVPSPEENETTAVLVEYLRAERDLADDDMETAVRIAAERILADLPDDAMVIGDSGDRYLMDGFEQRMHYDPEGGLGGRRPVLISAGADGKFDTEDDIRSDGG